MSIASISPSRPTSAGGRVPAPGLYGLRTASTARSIGFFPIYRNIAINVAVARPRTTNWLFLGVVAPDERSSTRCRAANQSLTKSHEPLRTDLHEETPTRSSKTKTLVDCSGRLRTLARGLGPGPFEGGSSSPFAPHTFARTQIGCEQG